MKGRKQLFWSLFFGVVTCACTTSKITHYPRWVGHQTGDSILVCDLHKQNIDLTYWCINEIKKHIPDMMAVSEQDIIFELKQYEVDLSGFQTPSSQICETISAHTGLRYILLSRLASKKDNTLGSQGNPNHLSREAILEFKLIDIQNSAQVWHCQTRVQIAPFIYQGESDYYFNITTSSTAVNKAYKKSIKKLVSALNTKFKL